MSNKNDAGSKVETVSQLAHRHMKDKTHTTSDDELKNATLDLGKVQDSLADTGSDVLASPDDNDEGEIHTPLVNI